MPEVGNQDVIRVDDAVYGGCEGPNSVFVKLISSDGHEFIVKREHAMTSGTIRNMLSGPSEENQSNEARFQEISSRVLQIVCVYFGCKANYEKGLMKEEDLMNIISGSLACEVCVASDFLDI